LQNIIVDNFVDCYIGIVLKPFLAKIRQNPNTYSMEKIAVPMDICESPKEIVIIMPLG